MNEPDWLSVDAHTPPIADDILMRSDKLFIRTQRSNSVEVYLGYYHDYGDPDCVPWWTQDGPDAYRINGVTHWAEAPKGELK